MPDTETTIRRQFHVTKDNGETWIIYYTSAGVRWVRSNQPKAEEPTDQGSEPSRGGQIDNLRTITSVIDSATNIGLWWEARQQRLLNEATNEESRRIPWLADMIARWGDAHRQGNQLDLRVSEYLAREAREMMDAIVSNKRVALPQSMLYELEIIQDTLRSFRSLILSQFEGLLGAVGLDVDSAVRNALPSRRLDMDFVRDLGRDPSIEWSERVRKKTSGDFDRELTEVLRHPEVFFSRLFPRKELTASEPVEVEKNPRVVDRLANLMTPALPRLWSGDSRPEASEKRDTFRELSLLPAEVARVRALNSAWLATCSIVEESCGSEVSVQISNTGLSVRIASAPTTPQLQPPQN